MILFYWDIKTGSLYRKCYENIFPITQTVPPYVITVAMYVSGSAYAEYCGSRAIPCVAESQYLLHIGTELHQDVDIMWTGELIILVFLLIMHEIQPQL